VILNLLMLFIIKFYYIFITELPLNLPRELYHDSQQLLQEITTLTDHFAEFIICYVLKKINKRL
jgi:hypothetical protein